MSEVNWDDILWLVEVLEKHPRDSLRSIAKKEGINYYKLKRIYDKYYGKYVVVSALYNITRIGLKSYIAFLSIPKSEIIPTAELLSENPFIVYITPIFGFKNGIEVILQIPYDQEKYLPEFFSRYSNDFELYEVWDPRSDPMKRKFGYWEYPYEYAVLMDILKTDARTPMKELEAKLGKKRPTINFMIHKLIEDKVIDGFSTFIENVEEVHDRCFIGISTKVSPEEVIKRFPEIEITIGILNPKGILIEWFFSSQEDIGRKVLEFSEYVDKLAIGYLDLLYELNNKLLSSRFSRMIRKDGKGYRSILEFI
ncbi:Lrp/AsnC family transcriptional regulator [Pyrococcus furiosus DSM 3638]|uniref:Lrp/AsnC family transcriptional regulator n=3 Tax=Pyrococcus furiosus TaxID=2261 RepID=A0A5C0XMD4_PYRFU|nr:MULTISPECIES: Lrp/AsnC family transcriptional regulator [Pyrococcus]AAL80371.1 putative HTH transcription regulator [Pyrococcus furiosus DSM 3638]AFN03033.1 HTH transcription regulator [Pyrococcus furiosus COM1]MDK2870543.1 hypothetical protein [Pyrococcus sp.]QEK77967.1 Lrp/AsnC family transcriptional regulator [Pyrococcus furiosus DSM 3638]